MAIFEGLLEDPELIPDAVAHRRHVQGGQGIEQAGGQPAQAPVPQPGLHVEILQVLTEYPDAATAWRARSAVPVYSAFCRSWRPSMYSADR